MRPLRPAGLLAGLMLLAALPTSSIAGGAQALAGAAPPVPRGQCGQPGLPPCPTPPPNNPLIAIAKSASPSSLPAGGGPVTYTYTVTNTGGVPLAGVTVTDDKCAPVVFVSGDTNGNTLLDLTETWTYTCTMTVTATTTNTATASGKDAAGTGTSAVARATVNVATSPPDCPPGSTDPHCVPPPCPPGTTGPNCTPPPPPPPKTTLVWECFDLQSRLVANKTVLLITKNFGNDTVHVLKSQRMCEPALKTKQRPPTGSLAPVLYPNTELKLDLMDPQGGRHSLMLGGTMGQMKLAAGGGIFDTEMLQLSLQSTMPMQVASPAGSFFDSFFDVFLDLDPLATSPGRLNSFFDVFTEMSLSRNMGLGIRGAVMHLRPGPLRFISDQQGSYGLSPAAPIPLNDPNGQPSGWTINGGTLTPSPTPTPNQVVTRVLECFLVEGGANLNHVYSLRTANFGLDIVRVQRAERLCEGALKSRQPIVAAAVPKPAPIIWECWTIDSPKAFQPTPFFLTTRNFKLDPVLVLRPHSLCEEAQKIRISTNGTVGETIGQPTGRVLECFTIEAKTRNLPFFLRTRNFGPDTVRVGRGTLMCEPAVKQPRGTN